ncbi:hypothetical protein [Variovorax sp. YR752]|uniref:hypothetical protein n=1 Tax=Variovorax sp. YR752 TaxID=1884383 RepID=UPI0031383FC2
MTQRPAKAASKTTAERRSGRDRRQVDKGPPGRAERRRVAEPRKPEVAELDMTESEWGALAQESVTPPPPDPKKRG